MDLFVNFLLLRKVFKTILPTQKLPAVISSDMEHIKGGGGENRQMKE